MNKNIDPRKPIKTLLIFGLAALAALILVYNECSAAESPIPARPNEVDPKPLTGKELLMHYADEACEEFGFSNRFVIYGVIETESNWQVSAYSNSGACGLMQIIPRYAVTQMTELGVTDIFDPRDNIRVGVKILVDLLKLHDQNLTAALMYYNEGARGASRYFQTWIPSPYATMVLTIASSYEEASTNATATT